MTFSIRSISLLLAFWFSLFVLAALSSDIPVADKDTETAFAARIERLRRNSAGQFGLIAPNPFVCKKVVPVVWHIITRDDSSKRDEGYIGKEELDVEMNRLNEVYNPKWISFEYSKRHPYIVYERIEKEGWDTLRFAFPDPYGTAPTYDDGLKIPRRLGGRDTLNIFIVNKLELSSSGADTLQGYGTYPYLLDHKEWGYLAKYRDAIVVRQDVLSKGPYRNPRVISHEAGHWLGLYHTFQGGCDESQQDDLVYDTPRIDDKNPHTTCRGGPIYTCPGSTRPDLTTNIMAYTSDFSCSKDLTNGQMERIHEQLIAYREYPMCEPSAGI